MAARDGWHRLSPLGVSPHRKRSANAKLNGDVKPSNGNHLQTNSFVQLSHRI
jgi:hypothetical protein